MNFIGSTDYYVLCFAALIVLILLLIKLQIKPKPQNVKSERQQPTEHIPKYAAGDDMDQINRKAYALWSEKKFSLKELPILFLGIIIVIGVLASESKKTVTVTPQATTPPSITQPTTPTTIPAPTGELQIVFNSVDFNHDGSKIFVTYTYINETSLDFHSVITTINLETENDTIIQSEVAETVDSVKANESKEITVPVTVDTDNIGKVKWVTIHTTYKRG